MRQALARLVQVVVAAGGLVITPESAPFLSKVDSWRALLGVDTPRPSLAYGDVATQPGLHLMETPTEHWVETLTGLGAAGVDVVLVAGSRPVEAHPLVPVVQVALDAGPSADGWREDFDLLLHGDPAGWAGELLRLLLRVASREYAPRLASGMSSDFQITRGRLGVSM